MLLFMEKLYDMHCHVGFAPAPATVAAEGAPSRASARSRARWSRRNTSSCAQPWPMRRTSLWPWAHTPGGSPTGAWAKPSWPGSASLRARPDSSGRSARLRRPARYGREPCPADERFRLYSGHMQRVRSALGTHQSRRRDSNQRAKPNLYRNHEPRGEPTQRRHPHPQCHRHCAEAHLHPRHQCRRSSTRCARTSQHLCAASRDLSLVLRHFR